MIEQGTRSDFSKQMWDKFEEREAKLAALEKNPVDEKWEPLDEQQLEKRRKEIMETFYGQLDEIKSKPWFKEAQKKHNDEIRARIAAMMKPEDQKLLEDLKNAKDIERRVQLFVTLTDKIPLDALAWIIPYYWDIGMSVLSTVLLINWWRKIWLEWKEIWKIVWYQIVDAVIWLIGLSDIIWNIADYFFKANKYSAKFFTQKVQELERQAKEKWIDPKKIEGVEQEMEQKMENDWKKISFFKEIADTFKKWINS